MLLAGDEVLRTQWGNNNAYCQDNAHRVVRLDIDRRTQDMLRFVRPMIAFRKRHPALRRKRFFTGRKEPGRRFPDISWHGEKLNEPPWFEPMLRCLPSP